MSAQIIPPRRNFLIRALGLTAGVAAVGIPTTGPAPKEPPASLGHFKTPLEYFLAMQAIGWRPLAMFQVRRDRSIHCMGVTETAASEELILKTWGQFHAIQMRTPVQLGPDGGGGWWEDVWQFLYDRGLREDVTRPARAP
jgi:hypothetical protein